MIRASIDFKYIKELPPQNLSLKEISEMFRLDCHFYAADYCKLAYSFLKYDGKEAFDYSFEMVNGHLVLNFYFKDGERFERFSRFNQKIYAAFTSVEET